MAHPTINGHTIHVPRWAITAILVASTVLGVGFTLGRTYDRLENTLETMEARLCRIERAVNVQPALSCPANPQPGGGR